MTTGAELKAPAVRLTTMTLVPLASAVYSAAAASAFTAAANAAATSTVDCPSVTVWS